MSTDRRIAGPLLSVLLATCGLSACGDAQRGGPAESASPAGIPPSAAASASAAPAPGAPSKGLTRASRRLVCEGMTHDLHLDAYVTKGLPAMDAFADALGALLAEYENATFEGPSGKVEKSRAKVRMVHPKTEEERRAAKGLGLTETALGSGDAASALQVGFSGMVLSYGSAREVIPLWSPNDTAGLEFFITTKIRTLRAQVEGRPTRIGVVTNKEELSLSDPNLVAEGKGLSLGSVFTEYFPSYKLVEVDLQAGAAAVDGDLKALIVTQPGEDYTDKELRRIDDFLMLGDKSVVFYVSAVNVPAYDAAMKATLDLHGLGPLLAGYGVEMRKDAILDPALGSRTPALSAAGTSLVLQTPGVVVLASPAANDGSLLDDSFPPFFRLPTAPFPFPSSLEARPARQPGATVRVVARTSEKAVSVEKPSVAMKPKAEWPTEGDAASRAIAIAVEGTIESAFPPAEGGAAVRSKSPSRVLVVSSSQFLTNPFARAGNHAPLPPQLQMTAPFPGDPELTALAGAYAKSYLTLVLLSFKNTLDWMSGDADMTELSASLAKKR